MKRVLCAALIVVLGLAGSAKADVVHADDVIIAGSECVGFDCLTDGTESFGFDTVRLKENNLQIAFDDTSSTAGFPANDWRIRVNDSSSGGASYFAVDDVSGARTPFMIEAGAPANALRINGFGRVGLGTATPVLKLHLMQGDTPAVRLEQDGSAGFSAQTWDLAGNEANFFVRDVTGGSRLPFRVQPGAPTNTLTLRADGRVGFGTWSPEAAVDVQRSDGTAQVRVLEASAAAASRSLLSLVNNGSPVVTLRDSSTGDSWKVGMVRLGSSAGNFGITREDGDGAEVLFYKSGAVRMGTGRRSNLTLSSRGNLTIRGVLNQSSDAAEKQNIAPVAGGDVLERIASLPLATWSYKDENPAVRHMGPMAQDFRTSFGLGESETSIAAIDADGVALAGIQELCRRLREKDAVIAGMQERLLALETLVQSLAGSAAARSRTASLAD